MAQDHPNQADPQNESSKLAPSSPPVVPLKPQAGSIDLKKILLPKKEVHAPQNAQRINAGALLESEQSATLPAPPPPKVPQAPPPATPKTERAVVQPLETYRGDIEQLVEKKNVSVVSIAAAEAMRRGASGAEPSPAAAPFDIIKLLKTALMIAGGVLLLAGASGALYLVLRPPQPVAIAPAAVAPFITVDDTKAFVIPAQVPPHDVVIQTLDTQRQQVALSLGLIDRFLLVTSATTTDTGATSVPLGTAQALTLLAPSVPAELLRALDPSEYLLGVHVYDGNQAFLILHTNAYEAAFSGMLAWEKTMRGELAPFFNRTPVAHIPEEGIATSTPTTTTPFLGTQFTDDIVENHDARVIKNDSGDILLLWSFLDRNTIVVTTNDATLREIISRLKNAPIVPIP